MEEPLLEFVRRELNARKARRGYFKQLAVEMEPETWERYHSWVTKVADGRIPDPGVSRVEELARYLRANPGEQVPA